MGWTITALKKHPKIRDAVLVEGLPGIGNVGKIALDFMIDQLKPIEAYDFYSHAMPHSVFVNKDSLVELPKIRVYVLKRFRKPDLVFLSGDVQPVDELSSHEFCETLLGLCKKLGVKKIITMGGIGLSRMSQEPRVYITGNSKEAIEEFSDEGLKKQLVGIVGSIIGVTGLLLGLAGKQHVDAVAYLVESFGHPLHIGVKEARALLNILDNKLALGLRMKRFDKVVESIAPKVRMRASGLTPKSIRSNKETSYIG